MAKRYQARHANKPHKDKSGQSVQQVEITAYNNDDNVVDFTMRGKSGETTHADIDWGSVKAPEVGSRYLCRIEMRKKIPVKLSPLKRIIARDKQLLAVARKRGKGWEFSPTERNMRKVFSGSIDIGKDISEGDLVAIIVSGNRATGIETNYGSVEGVAGINKLSLLQGGVEEAFPYDVMKAAEA